MTKEFIPYEQALELKKLGFDGECLGLYRNGSLEFKKNTGGYYDNKWINKFNESKICTAPLYQQAFRWFREKYGLGHMINGIGFESFIMNIGGVVTIFPMFKTYEEAELECLKKLIEIVKHGT
jgi:hypothetical protein